MEIKQLSNKDELKVIMDIWLSSNLDAHNFIDEAYFLNNFQTVKSAIAKANVYYAYENNEIIGFIGLVDSYIAGIFVRANSRRKKVGQVLLNFAKSNHDSLTLDVFEKNKLAYKFYLNNDFRIKRSYLDSDTNEKSLSLLWKDK